MSNIWYPGTFPKLPSMKLYGIQDGIFEARISKAFPHLLTPPTFLLAIKFLRILFCILGKALVRFHFHPLPMTKMPLNRPVVTRHFPTSNFLSSYLIRAVRGNQFLVFIASSSAQRSHPLHCNGLNCKLRCHSLRPPEIIHTCSPPFLSFGLLNSHFFPLFTTICAGLLTTKPK